MNLTKQTMIGSSILAFGVVLFLIIVILYSIPNKQTANDIANSCVVSSRVTINGYVFNCSLVGMKLSIKLPSGTNSIIYKEFK